jgi:hypothetical protein
MTPGYVYKLPTPTNKGNEMDNSEAVTLIAESSHSLFEAMFDITHTEDWKMFDLDDQIDFRNTLEEYYAAACIIREKFDSDVWKGHANGTVNPLVKSIRKQREGDTPGKKAEPKTAASLLKKRLSK